MIRLSSPTKRFWKSLLGRRHGMEMIEVVHSAWGTVGLREEIIWELYCNYRRDRDCGDVAQASFNMEAEA